MLIGVVNSFHLLIANFILCLYIEIMFFFVRSAIVYSIAFVKVKCFEKESKEFFERSAQELSSSNKKNDPLIEQDLTQRLEKAIQIQQQNATAMASFYARLLLHCSNFENRKEDEHFFECIYFYVCAVVKLSIASEYWQLIEQELGKCKSYASLRHI
jgi:hypothetical protein